VEPQRGPAAFRACLATEVHGAGIQKWYCSEHLLPHFHTDWYCLQLNYYPYTPPSSYPSPSGGLDDLDGPWYLDGLQQPQRGDYIPYPQCPYPSDLAQQSYFKSEYTGLPVTMAHIPHAPVDESMLKAEYSDDSRQGGKMEMDQEEVDAIIRNRRKVRDPKACYACHRRKVKCDRGLPCDSCVKRDHPELCSYERPTKKRRIALSSALAQADGRQPEPSSEGNVNSGPNITVPKEQWQRLNRELEQLRAAAKEDPDDGASTTAEEQSASGLASRSDEGDREGVHAPSNQMGTMHLGSRSVLAYMIGNRTKSTQDTARSLLEENILPNLGLDNETTTYPFVDLWSTDSSMQDVSSLVKALPEDSLCREFWLTYRDIPCVIYPVVPDAQAFDQTLNYLLQQRAHMTRTGAEIDPNRPYGVSLPWLALLFAVLASGSQSTGRLAKERELTSQVYICCSYQALRMSNFLTHPQLETIEALLIIGNALSYNMNPGVSYILLGMTLRSAFSMGLHVQSKDFSEHENYLRSRIWWALAWQDSHFSVSYDRPSSAFLCTPDLPFTKHSTPGTRTYVESMTQIIRLTQEILRDRALSSKKAMSWNMIMKYKSEVHRIWEDALPRLRDRQKCVSMTDHLERLALAIHCSYMISEICRSALKEEYQPAPTSHPGSKQSPIISPESGRRKSSSAGSPTSTPGDPQLISHLRAECIKYLEKVVETYVEIRDINRFGARSWIGIQRAISAAFLLGILPETKQEPRVINLLNELEKCIKLSAVEDSGFAKEAELRRSQEAGHPFSGGPSKDSPLWVQSMTKSLSALSNLNAALASNKAGFVNQQIFPPFAGFPSVPPTQAAAMYNSPAVSPGSGNSVTGVRSHTPQHPFGFNASTRSGLQMNPQTMSPMGPSVAPDSMGGDAWSYGNITERALEYVQPGLWG